MEKQIVICLYTVLSICFFTPMTFFISSYGELDINLTIILKKLLAISVLAGIVLCLVPPYTGNWNDDIFKKVYLSIIFFIGIFAFFQSTFIMGFVGKLDGTPFRANQGIYVAEAVFSLAVAGILIYYFKSQIFLTTLYKVCLWLLIAQVVFFIPQGKKYLTTILNKEDVYWFKHHSLKLDKYNVYSKDKNIAIVLMDGFGKGIFEEFINKYQEYKKIFKDFEFYPNTVSERAFTAIAIPALFTRQEPSEASFNEKTYKEIKDLFSRDDALLNVLKKHGFRNYVYPFFTNLMYLNSDFTDNIKDKTDYDVIDATYNRLIGNVIRFYAYPFYKKKGAFDYLTQITMNRNSLEIPNDYFHEDDFYKHFLTAIKTNDEKKVFHFYHLRGMHEPFMLDENFKVRELKEGDPVETTAKLYMTMLQNYINRLKEAGIYDKTAIILMSDHGSGRFISPLQTEKEFSQNSLLLYKNFNTKQDEMKTIENIYAGIIDIADLVLYSAGITDKKWNLRKPEYYKKLLTSRRHENLKNYKDLQFNKMSPEQMNYTAEQLSPSKIFTYFSVNRSATITLMFPKDFQICEKYLLMENSTVKYFLSLPHEMPVFYNDTGDYLLTTINFKADYIPNWIYNMKFLCKMNDKYYETPIGEISLEDNQMKLITPIFNPWQ
ncbi:MAG: sulfatase-like hydrolase/transferase [Alphaproteobacteria bacterium]|nr:sulfatase-like hydrolase/transferase [Alphaproteobacteria bacterium]